MRAIRVPLTLSQRDIFFDQLTQLESPIYNIGGYISCRNINVRKLQEAHKRLVSDCDVFGLRIVEEGKDVLQYVAEERDTALNYVDFCHFEQPEQEAKKWLEQRFQTVLPFFNSQLCFGYLLQVSSKELWYVGIGHHLAIDGWGFLNWSYKLAEYYNTGQAQENEGLSYSEMSQADQDYLAGKRFQQDKQFWKGQSILTEQRLLSVQYHDEQAKSAEQAVSSRFRKPICRKWFEQCSELCKQHRTGAPQF